ncbi:hypothetical protein [Sorangium sp. So ce124]
MPTRSTPDPSNSGATVPHVPRVHTEVLAHAEAMVAHGNHFR